MNSQIDNPFETIESAHDFVTLLSKSGLRSQAGTGKRRAERIRFGCLTPLRDPAHGVYMLDKLEAHMSRSKRLLNDLRTLRRRSRPARAQGRGRCCNRRCS